MNTIERIAENLAFLGKIPAESALYLAKVYVKLGIVKVDKFTGGWTVAPGDAQLFKPDNIPHALANALKAHPREEVK